MEIKRLIKQANDISSFFETERDWDKGAAGVADHIRKFWDPRMRREILIHLDENGGAGLRPLVIKALQRHGHELDPGMGQPTPAAPGQ